MSAGQSGTWLRGGEGSLAWGAAAYLALFPLGSFLAIPVGGTRVTGSDLLLGLLLFMGGVTWFRSPGFRATALRGLAGGWRAIRPFGSTRGADDVAASLLLLAAFSVWVASSAAWGSHPEYAVMKGAGYAALTVGAAVVVWSGIEWDRALSAWLLGVLLTVGVSLALAGVAAVAVDGGGSGWAARALHEGGSLGALPGRRLRGPFLRPDGLGDYLVVSGALLWGGWPLWSGIRPGSRHGEAAAEGATWGVKWGVKWTSRLLALLLAVALVLTLSSAWVAAGVLLLLLGRRISSRGRATSATSRPFVGLLLRGGGALVAATTFAALVFPLRLGWGDGQVVTSGIRAQIWEVAFRVFRSNPVTGVGAAPVIAEAVDPVDPNAGLQLWDAHNLYLSVMGQFGLVGTLLGGAAAFFLIRGVLRTRGSASAGTIRRPGAGDRESSGAAGAPGWRLSVLRERAQKGALAALGAVAIHGLVITGEDFRHWWALVAVAGLLVRASGHESGRDSREETAE